MAHNSGEEKQAKGGLGYDWAAAVLSLIFISGIFVDGWAHNHHAGIDTFFTPWHALFYGGFALNVLFYAVTAIRNHAAGYAWARSVPTGYAWTVLGALLFFASGAGDMIWHLLFGIEVSTEALLSPTHLGLATGGFLMALGPYRAAVARGSDAGGSASLWPAVLSLTVAFSALTFITQFAPALGSYGTGARPPQDIYELKTDRGIVSQLFQVAITMSFVLLALRQFGSRLPFGSLTVLLTLNAALMSTQIDAYRLLPGVLVTGLLGDALLRLASPSAERLLEFRAFAFALPAIYAAFHYLTLLVAGEQLYYSVHLWAGVIVISGAIGLLLSFLLIPTPRGAAADTPS